jgi:hypothetical protein
VNVRSGRLPFKHRQQNIEERSMKQSRSIRQLASVSTQLGSSFLASTINTLLGFHIDRAAEEIDYSIRLNFHHVTYHPQKSISVLGRIRCDRHPAFLRHEIEALDGARKKLREKHVFGPKEV